MSEPATPQPPEVHALLVCREVRADANGEISLHGIVEVLPVDSLPAQVGPLNFVAFVRGLTPGPCAGAFRLYVAGTGEPLGRLPLSVQVPAGYGERQVALQVQVAALPVARGGWLTLALEWDGKVIARTRFAVGVRSGPGRETRAQEP